MPGCGSYDPVVSCSIKIMENSNSIYDIQVKDCLVGKIYRAVAQLLIAFRFKLDVRNAYK